MIRIVSYEGQPAAQLLDRAVEVRRDVTQAVEAIVEDVRLRGDEAVLDYCKTFDGARPDGLLVPEEELDAAFSQVEPEFLDTLRLAAGNIERFHRLQKRAGFVDTPSPGVVVGQRVLPRGYHPIVDQMPDDRLLQHVERVRQAIATCVEAMPSHQRFIDEHCKATIE